MGPVGITSKKHSESPGLGVPDVSVVIPAFNEAGFIRQAVRSALAQTIRNIEIIVVDDGSTDNTAGLLKSQHDPRLRILHQAHSGLATARNTGVCRARGKFVAFLDADDLWVPEKLERHLEVFDGRPDLDMTFSLSKMIDIRNRQIGFVVPRRSGTVSFEQLFRENLVRNGSAAVLRAGVIEEAGLFDPELEASTDLDMWLRVARLRDRNIYCIGECLTLYRRRPGQTTSNRQRMARAWHQVLNKVNSAQPKASGRLFSRANSDKLFYFACLAYEAHEYEDAIRLVKESFRQCPTASITRIRPWMLAAACCSGMVFPPPIHRHIAAFGAVSARAVSRVLLAVINLPVARNRK